MYLVAIAWIYVVLMMAVAEAMSSQGSLLGALVTFLLYGVLPLGIVLYVMGAPGRRKARRAAEERAMQAESAAPPERASGIDPDGGGLASGDAVPPEGKEP